MKVKCINNYNPGLLGYDYRKELVINKVYNILMDSSYTFFLFNETKKWEYYPCELFQPVEIK
jgi:hypothetical protein